MILQLGLCTLDPVWIQVLDQEKVPYRVIDDLNPQTNPVIAFTKPHSFSSGQISHFFSKGGIGIVDQNDWTQHQFKNQTICLDFTELNRLSGHQKAIDKNFLYRDFSVMEKAAEVKKSEVRKKIIHAVKAAFWKQNLPFVHLWYYPNEYESVFSFRFDFDEHEPKDFETVCDLLNDYKELSTCFVCMKTYEHLDSEMKQLAATGVEIGSHAYVHHVYHSYAQNKHNLSKAGSLLKKSVPKVDGFAGPHGKWHESLDQALEEEHYSYSSEFCLDYDNFPMYPLVNGRFSKVLHIATHPVCEGVFLERYPFNEEMFDQYYSQVIHELADQNLPVLIFGHPDNRIGKYPQILHNIVKRVNERKNIWKTNFGAISAWWNRRHNQTFTFDFENDTLRLLNSLDGPFSWEIESQGRKSSLLSTEDLVKGVTLKCLSFKQINKIPLLIEERPVKHRLMKRLKMFVKEVLDWETKTSLKDLQKPDITAMLKYVMRFIHDAFSKKEKHSLYS